MPELPRMAFKAQGMLRRALFAFTERDIALAFLGVEQSLTGRAWIGPDVALERAAEALDAISSIFDFSRSITLSPRSGSVDMEGP